MTKWTFLTNHALVLSFLARHPRITARDISSAVGITERATRRIIADLDAAGYINKNREGRRIRYHINHDLPLRHHTHRDTAVGDLLEALGWEGRRKRKPAPRVAGEKDSVQNTPLGSSAG